MRLFPRGRWQFQREVAGAALAVAAAVHGRQHTYTLLGARVPPTPERDPDEALVGDKSPL
ncbi:hypothetical protein ACIA5D_45230 [Actinoplanes sp. NPDC051513]|uniref:hypothetical protein n=1 Tax=Actinoplanes sp. NPDC051513 TaxID=3363908 RepID=UPI003790B065